MNDLKECPFCASVNVAEQNDVVVSSDGDEGYSEWIECGACGGRAPSHQAWNLRAGRSAEDPMNAIEKRARNLLAAEVDRDAAAMPGVEEVATSIRQGGHGNVLFVPTAIRAIVAALTQPEGHVLVPAIPTKQMMDAAVPADSQDQTGRRQRALWDAMLAARPEVP